MYNKIRVLSARITPRIQRRSLRALSTSGILILTVSPTFASPKLFWMLLSFD